MKRIIILVLFAALFSCQKGEKIHNIVCNVENAEGIELVYYVKGEDFKNRQTKRIKDGKVIFEMKNQTNEVGIIESSLNIKKGNKFGIKILPETKNINISFNVTKDSIQIDYNVFEPVYRFRNINFTTNSISKEYRKITSQLREIRYKGGISYSKLDSLSKHVFPSIQTKKLNLYEKIVNSSPLNDVLKTEILHDMLVMELLFEKVDYISEKEKEKINIFFKEIKTNSKISSTYFMLQEKINSINKVKPKKTKFKEFILEDINGKKVSLSNLVEKNEFTLLYFWVHNCGPCRSFNKKLKSKNKILIENNIAIVHVNVDLSRDYWKKATKQDSISWTNLYAGKNIDLHNNYRIKSWPTKAIFNKNKKLIDFEFINPEDLLKLVK